MSQEQTLMDQRIPNIFRIGTVIEVDYSAKTCVVQDGDVITPMIPFPASNAGGDVSWHPVEVGEQVSFGSPSGDLANAVVMNSYYQGDASGNEAGVSVTSFKNGTVISYDRNSNKMDINLASGGTLNIVSENGKFKGDFEIDGKLKVTDKVETPLVECDEAEINGKKFGGHAVAHGVS